MDSGPYGSWWSPDEVTAWLSSRGLPPDVVRGEFAGVDGRELLALTEEDFSRVKGISLMKAKGLFRILHVAPPPGPRAGVGGGGAGAGAGDAGSELPAAGVAALALNIGAAVTEGAERPLVPEDYDSAPPLRADGGQARARAGQAAPVPTRSRSSGVPAGSDASAAFKVKGYKPHLEHGLMMPSRSDSPGDFDYERPDDDYEPLDAGLVLSGARGGDLSGPDGYEPLGEGRIVRSASEVRGGKTNTPAYENEIPPGVFARDAPAAPQRPGPTPSDASRPWFVGKATREDCNRAVLLAGEGDFLVRESSVSSRYVSTYTKCKQGVSRRRTCLTPARQSACCRLRPHQNPEPPPHECPGWLRGAVESRARCTHGHYQGRRHPRRARPSVTKR